eukprot:4046037-Amphidinium_carterae.1
MSKPQSVTCDVVHKKGQRWTTTKDLKKKKKVADCLNKRANQLSKSCGVAGLSAGVCFQKVCFQTAAARGGPPALRCEQKLLRRFAQMPAH